MDTRHEHAWILGWKDWRIVLLFYCERCGLRMVVGKRTTFLVGRPQGFGVPPYKWKYFRDEAPPCVPHDEADRVRAPAEEDELLYL